MPVRADYGVRKLAAALTKAACCRRQEETPGRNYTLPPPYQDDKQSADDRHVLTNRMGQSGLQRRYAAAAASRLSQCAHTGALRKMRSEVVYTGRRGRIIVASRTTTYHFFWFEETP